MSLPRLSGCIAAVGAAAALVAACTVQLVAPYNSDLQQKASAMQAEAATWDLTMRASAGTIAADPRNPSVSAMLNKWRGEADAMLTLAVSNDTGIAQCGQAVKAVAAKIEAGIPPSLLAAAPPAAPAGNAGAATPAGCEAQMVANIATDIDDIATALKYCHVDWVPDSYFAGLAQNSAAAPKPPAAPDNAKQLALNNSCGFEFKPRSQTPASAAEAGHGQAVSALLLTLQEIVYIESHKKATTTAK
jgi:hypothetical protein